LKNNQQFYFIHNKPLPSLDGVNCKAEGKDITLWLGGIDYHSLPSIQNQSTFAIIDYDKQETTAQLKVTAIAKNG
jgi:hypothetical protein